MPIPNIVSAETTVGPEFWLNAANGAVRRFCGWHVAPLLEETLTLDGSGGRVLLLPSKRVVEILAVSNDGADVTANVDHSKAGILELVGGTWSNRLGKITVSLKHGFDLEEVPEVAGVIASLRTRGASNAGTVVAQAMGPASVRNATGKDGGTLSIPLLQSEKDTLEPYRLNWGA